MARPRTIKPEYFRDKVIAQLGSQVGTVFQALWCTADDGGVAPADPDLLRGEMLVRWPEYTLPVVTHCLQRLADRGRIELYAVEGALYARIPTLSEHSPGRGRFRHPRGGESVSDLKAFIGRQLGLIGYETVPNGTDRPASASPIPNPFPSPSPVPEEEAAAARPRREKDTTGVPSPANGVPTLSYLQRCVIALNTGLHTNPQVPHPREVPSSTQAGVVSWEADGVPIELVERVVRERAAAYEPKGSSRQPHSLRYFDGAVREAWELEQQPTGGPIHPADQFRALAERIREGEAHASESR